MKLIAPTGLIPILATPFSADGSLDLPSLRALVEFQLHCGVDAVAVFGMASEGFALTEKERVLILRTVREVVGPELAVIAGVNATSTQLAIEQGQVAAAEGADQLMVLPPFLVKPSPAQLVDFYADVAAAVDVQLMVQDAPAVTGVALPVPLIVELSHGRGITAVKVEAPPTAPKIAAITSATSELAVLGGGNALAVLEELTHGAVGTMPACEFSDVLRLIIDEQAAGRTAHAREQFDRLLPLLHLGTRPGQAWAIHKEVLVRRGVITEATVRSPAAPLDPVTAHTLAQILDVLQLPRWGSP